MEQDVASTRSRIRQRYLLGTDGFLCSGALMVALAPLGQNFLMVQALVIAAALLAGSVIAWYVHRHPLHTRDLIIVVVGAFLGWPVSVAAAVGVGSRGGPFEVWGADGEGFAGLVVLAIVVVALAPSITEAVIDLLRRHEHTAVSGVRLAALVVVMAGVAAASSWGRNELMNQHLMLLLRATAHITSAAVLVIADILVVRRLVGAPQPAVRSGAASADRNDAVHRSGQPPEPRRLPVILSMVAFGLMTPLGLLSGAAIMLFSSPYPLGTALAYTAWWIIPVVGLSYGALRRPHRAGPILAVVTVLAIAWNVAELAGAVPLASDLAAPTGAGALLGVGVALAFLGLRRSLLAGLLLLAVGLTVPAAGAILATIWGPDGPSPYGWLHMPFGYWVRWYTAVGAVFLMAGILDRLPLHGPNRDLPVQSATTATWPEPARPPNGRSSSMIGRVEEERRGET